MAGEGKPGKARVDEGPMPFDTSVAHLPRVYNYWLGGKDNFAARSVRYLAAGAGVRQFLDIGTGIPTENNTHEVAQGIAPVARLRLRRQRPLQVGLCARMLGRRAA